jgi:hypothetical protein
VCKGRSLIIEEHAERGGGGWQEALEKYSFQGLQDKNGGTDLDENNQKFDPLVH